MTKKLRHLDNMSISKIVKIQFKVSIFFPQPGSPKIMQSCPLCWALSPRDIDDIGSFQLQDQLVGMTFESNVLISYHLAQTTKQTSKTLQLHSNCIPGPHGSWANGPRYVQSLSCGVFFLPDDLEEIIDANQCQDQDDDDDDPIRPSFPGGKSFKPKFFSGFSNWDIFQMLLKETTYLRNHRFHNFTLSHIWNMLFFFTVK